jgi:four helix bundle protein
MTIRAMRGAFDFEQMTVYQKALNFYEMVSKIKFSCTDEGRIIARQFRRAALSITLNLAEGSGRKSYKDRRNFYVISRGSLFECTALLLVLERSNDYINYDELYRLGVEIGKMLSTMITNLERKIAKGETGYSP